MTKDELIEAVYDRHLKRAVNRSDFTTKKEIKGIIEDVFDEVDKSLVKEKRFSWPGLGVFKVKKRAARVGRNPTTGQKIFIPPRKSVLFTPSERLKLRLN